MSFENYQKLKRMGLDMADIQAPVPACSVQYCEEAPMKEGGLCRACSKKRKADPVYYSLTEEEIRARIKKNKGEQQEYYKENLECFLRSKSNQALFDKSEYDLQTIIAKYIHAYSTIGHTSQYTVNNDLKKIFKKGRDKMSKEELVKVLSYLKKHYPISQKEKKPEFKHEIKKHQFFSVDIDSRTKDTIKAMDYNKDAIFIDIDGMPIGIHILPEGGVHIVTLGNKIEIPKEGHVAMFKIQE